MYFSHEIDEKEDWILGQSPSDGTLVTMTLNRHTTRSMTKLYSKFAAEEDDYGFTKTVVPVRLAELGEDSLVSRSQAKRLLTRLDRFKVVMLNFEGVSEIGQAFADEIFRVFRNQKPDVQVYHSKANARVQAMIDRAELLHQEQSDTDT